MHLFFTPDLNGTIYTLNETESKHCVRVLRLTEGDQIELIDGKGGFFEAIITEAKPKACTVKVTKSELDYQKRNFNLHIAIGPTKSIDRTEWFLEKATEIGIDEITPILCHHSERKVVKQERLEKIVVSAMKQSLKAYYPKLNDLVKFETLIRQPFDGLKFIAHCEDDSAKIHLKSQIKKGDNVLVLIGPEGDFSPNEIQLAIENGFKPISLGESRLRTETAGVVACHIINLANEA